MTTLKRPSMAGNQHARKGVAKDTSITIRCTSVVKAKAQAGAAKRDMSVSDYLALIINAQK